MHTITSTQNPTVKRAMTLHQKKGRQAEGAIFCEGQNALDMSQAHWVPTHIFVDDTHFEAQYVEWKPRLPEDTEWVRVSTPVMKTLSTTQSAPPIAAILKRRTQPWHWRHCSSTTPLFLILDRLQDPGNIGTLIRSALAFGVDGLLLTQGCVDPFSPKVIRSSAGASLSAPIYHHAETLPQLLQSLSQQPIWGPTLQVWGTCGQREPEPASEIKPATTIYPLNQLPEPTHSAPMALILGNEGQGIDDQAINNQARQQPIRWLTIPTEPIIESLNVAMCGSIILNTLYSQRDHQRGTSS